MPDKIFVFDQIRRLMGWCPACKKKEAGNEQPFCFANQTTVSGKKKEVGVWPDFQTSNVTFPANTTLFTLGLVTGINLLLTQNYLENFYHFLAGLLLFNALCFCFVIKTFSAAVLVDDRGVHLQGFRLKELEIPYKEIEAVPEHKSKKRSKKASIALRGLGTLGFCGGFAYMALTSEWREAMFIASLGPFLLFLLAKQKALYQDQDTQLYIKTRHKKWYELSFYYSVLTDEASAKKIKAEIEKHLK